MDGELAEVCEHELSENTKLQLLEGRHAEELTDLTDRNREYLRAWLPWVKQQPRGRGPQELHKGRSQAVRGKQRVPGRHLSRRSLGRGGRLSRHRLGERQHLSGLLARRGVPGPGDRDRCVPGIGWITSLRSST